MENLDLSKFLNKQNGDAINADLWNELFTTIQTKVNEIVSSINGEETPDTPEPENPDTPDTPEEPETTEIPEYAGLDEGIFYVETKLPADEGNFTVNPIVYIHDGIVDSLVDDGSLPYVYNEDDNSITVDEYGSPLDITDNARQTLWFKYNKELSSIDNEITLGLLNKETLSVSDIDGKIKL